jgi:acetamidase/formamidase
MATRRSAAKPVLIRQRGKYSYVYTPFLKPIAKVKQGQPILLHTPDAFENRLSRPEHLCSQRCTPPFFNPQVGPIHVQGAKAGDTLAVTIHSIEPDRDYVVSALVPNFGALTSTSVTATLNKPLPEETRIWPLKDGFVHFNDKIRIPYEPFVGTIGVAPKIEAINALTPGYWGGNMDCVETSPGREVWFPVLVDGAHFFIGDAHATQGDGELTGVACELAAKVVVSFRVIKNKTIAWPRIISDDEIMVAGSARPLDDAVRIAWCEMVRWLAADYGFTELDAYHLIGQVGKMRVGNMVDPNYTVVAKVAKKWLQ